MNTAVLIAIGFAGGVLGGMGLGGGTLLIPLMTLLADVPQKTAAAVNLIAFVPMAATALAVHAKNGLIQKDAIAPTAIPAATVCALFSLLACNSKDKTLSRAFGIFLVVLGLLMLAKLLLSALAEKTRLAMQIAYMSRIFHLCHPLRRAVLPSAPPLFRRFDERGVQRRNFSPLFNCFFCAH